MNVTPAQATAVRLARDAQTAGLVVTRMTVTVGVTRALDNGPLFDIQLWEPHGELWVAESCVAEEAVDHAIRLWKEEGRRG